MKLWIDTAGVASAERLFGLPPLERMRRSAGKQPDIDAIALSGPDARADSWPGAQADADAAPLGTRLRRALARDPALVVIDGAQIVDPRLIGYLASAQGNLLASRGEGAGRAVALRLQQSVSAAIPENATSLIEVADALSAAGVLQPVAENDFPAYIDKLRRSIPYWIWAVEDANARRRLERQMFWDNYKGSTDLLTRYVYPPLVWPSVQLCTRYGITPNMVTIVSIILAFAAVPLFAQGDFFWGFVCAYGMSVLDSVDGKVARLTLTDSKIGNVLDHGLDQVHPPFWYFAWAWGLGAHQSTDLLYQAAVWLIIFYIADRLVLAVAKRRLRFALHAATRLDTRVRSLIARRNITMTIMAFALLIGQGAAGLLIVTAWQGLTFAWHSFRTLWLGFIKRRTRPEA